MPGFVPTPNSGIEARLSRNSVTQFRYSFVCGRIPGEAVAYDRIWRRANHGRRSELRCFFGFGDAGLPHPPATCSCRGRVGRGHLDMRSAETRVLADRG